MAQPTWNTASGSIGTFPANIAMSFALSASPVSPATTLTYSLLSGTLPTNLSLSSAGVISGTAETVLNDTTYTFVVRATDNLTNIRDRTFTITISSIASPKFTTPNGTLINVIDSEWLSFQVSYSNPISTNTVIIRKVQGDFPPGIEINDYGIIRGYPEPPVQNTPYSSTTTVGLQTTTENKIRCQTTSGFVPGRPVIFYTTAFGNIQNNVYYYIREVFDSTTFSISTSVDGPEFLLANATGTMVIELPAVSALQPTKKSYNFTLKLDSEYGEDFADYTITIINQNLPSAQGGPGNPPNTRYPVIFNTRPNTYNIQDTLQYRYYILPNDTGATYPPSTPANIGQILSDNYFSFQILGHDFDNDTLLYEFINLPSDLSGDSSTGWITGTPSLAANSIANYDFAVICRKVINTYYYSDIINFSIQITNNLSGLVTWVTPADLGSVNNGSESIITFNATSDVELQYRVTSGTLPPNTELLTNGELIGTFSFEPGNTVTSQNGTNVFTFTVEAFSPVYPVITESRTFTLTVFQRFVNPVDTLYIQASPSLADRVLIDSLLTNTTIIPDNFIYRPNDPNYGKATSVVYEHAYGIDAATIIDYVAAVTQNHYWRNLILGEIKTAVARDDNGVIIYEVVYSQIIDNLINPQGISIEQSIYWPVPIDLNLGPWYTSITDIYTSWASVLSTSYYTSLTPGYAQTLYPNSLVNMRTRIQDVIGSQDDFRLLPRWMTSQQLNGSTLGYTPAWVICYTKPGFSEVVKDNINTLWTDNTGNLLTLNKINFQIDRFSVDKSLTYNYDTTLDPKAWVSLPGGDPVPNPIDSKNFSVLFPRKTILPNTPQSY